MVWRTKRSEANRLLGKTARPVLDEVIELLRKVARERDWPLQRINIRYHQDIEFADWEMLIINPVFKARLEVAREYLLSFCQELDAFRDSLGKLKKRKFVQILTYEIGVV